MRSVMVREEIRAARRARPAITSKATTRRRAGRLAQDRELVGALEGGEFCLLGGGPRRAVREGACSVRAAARSTPRPAAIAPPPGGGAEAAGTGGGRSSSAPLEARLGAAAQSLLGIRLEGQLEQVGDERELLEQGARSMPSSCSRSTRASAPAAASSCRRASGRTSNAAVELCRGRDAQRWRAGPDRLTRAAARARAGRARFPGRWPRPSRGSCCCPRRSRRSARTAGCSRGSRGSAARGR